MSSPSKAWDLTRMPVAAAVTVIPALENLSDTVPVPTPTLKSATDTTPDEVSIATAPAPAPGLAFASLAAAVAAQDMGGAMNDELECLADAVYFESKGEPLNGQLAVAEVIINRTTSGRFPSSICSVVKQPGQFSFVRGGRIPDAPSGQQYRTATAIAKIALADAWDSPAPKALYFHARRVSPGWNRARVASIGNHIFFR
ncbi:cell wall hydrolase [Sphingomonas panacisoli]|uniref:Cell wall hydrolase n=1 Tax=Sphingomonas panacisoli TaxID=1813879 RepID=A0A5B8LMN8_9SPHN|nr:cell wall hydrolase [Sphingomonas panacisoli]QDZ08864.1 cell wall hydrolase [Sphingomonas panacisoli]